MEKDEIFRRAMAAALAVTGRAGRRAARISVGLCIASATTGCLQDAANDDQMAANGIDSSILAGDIMVQGPNMRPDMNPGEALDLGRIDLSVAAETDSGPPLLADLGATPSADADIPNGDAELGVDGTLAEHCLPVDGRIADWRCCEDHNWDRSIEGCEPCDMGTEQDTWTNCVTCAARDETQASFEDYMACCDAVRFDFDMGCMAWGPPAPPQWDGRTLDELLADLDRRA